MFDDEAYSKGVTMKLLFKQFFLMYLEWLQDQIDNNSYDHKLSRKLDAVQYLIEN